jgi:hypothetical protein
VEVQKRISAVHPRPWPPLPDKSWWSILQIPRHEDALLVAILTPSADEPKWVGCRLMTLKSESRLGFSVQPQHQFLFPSPPTDCHEPLIDPAFRHARSESSHVAWTSFVCKDLTLLFPSLVGFYFHVAAILPDVASQLQNGLINTPRW